MTLSEFEAHHCNPRTLAFQAFYPIPAAQLCGASLGTGGSPWARLSSLPPGPTLTVVTAFLPHLSAPTNVPPPLSVSGKCTLPHPPGGWRVLE